MEEAKSLRDVRLQHNGVGDRVSQVKQKLRKLSFSSYSLSFEEGENGLINLDLANWSALTQLHVTIGNRSDKFRAEDFKKRRFFRLILIPRSFANNLHLR